MVIYIHQHNMKFLGGARSKFAVTFSLSIYINLFEQTKTSYFEGFVRAPTTDVGYVPNAKYLAHIPHQTPFDPIYQMCHISYFLQHAIVESQICHGMERVWHMIYSFFIPLSLLSLRQSHLVNPNPLLSNPNPHCSSTPTPTPTITSTPISF